MKTSERGRLVPPNLDDRTWKDIVEQARALIPKYAPQWTDHNPSDLGMTLVELFAWMVEGMTYRLNRVPEKNYVAFLNLLGITRDPQTPARSYLTFSAQPGSVKVPKGSQAQTQGSETEPPIVFETDDDLTVLPINMTVALHIAKANLNKYSNISSAFTVPPAGGTTLHIASGTSVLLCLGFDKPTTQPVRLRFRLFRPLVIPKEVNPAGVVKWVYSTDTVEPSSWAPIPQVTDDTRGLTKDGEVTLTIPATWAAQCPTTTWTTVTANSAADAVADSYYWVGIRIHNVAAEPIRIGFNWILFNAVSSFHALTVPPAGALPEGLGRSNGKPFQVFPLRYRPLFKRPETDTPYDHVEIRVDGTVWTLVDEFLPGPGNYYRVEPVAGEIRFGNHDTVTGVGNGTIPLAGALVEAAAYRYAAGGTQGLVGAGAINTLRTSVPGIIEVRNLFSSFGASDEEPIEETKRRAPDVLRIRDRAITAEDYEYLAREATTDVAVVRCLEPRLHEAAKFAVNGTTYWLQGDPWTFGGIDRSPGNVNIIVVPDSPDPQPKPTKDLLREVHRYLDRRRGVGARLQVLEPRYLPVTAEVDAIVWTSAIQGGLIENKTFLKARIIDALTKFFHPTRGGPLGKGWLVGQHVFVADVFRAIAPNENIGFISTLTICPNNPPTYLSDKVSLMTRPFPLSLKGASVWVTDYELVCAHTSFSVNVNTQ